MVTKKRAIPFSQYFGASHQGYHLRGKEYRDLFVEEVEDFFTRMNHHCYIAGQPGVGKTYAVEAIAKKYPKVYLLVLKGKMTNWAFVKTIAVNVMLLPKGWNLAVYIDDMNNIFKSNSDFLDMFKIAMDKSSGDRVEYNTSLGGQYEACEDIEKQAIDHFKALDPNRTGFVVPFNGRVKFIFTMNTSLPGKQEMDKLEVGSDKWIKLNNRAAIRSRVRYEDLIMNKETYWGWIADVTWNDPLMCAGSTSDQKFEILMWLWDNWDTLSETSLRFVEEKMWDTMQQWPKPKDYRARWEKLKG
jgi:hypothetical protein